MTRFLLRRLVRAVVAFIFVSLGAMLLVNLSPTDPAVAIAGGEAADPEVVEAVRQQYGFDKPIATRYFDWLAGLSHGDLGTSFLNNRPVSELIGQRLQVTVELALLAMLLVTVIVVPLGLYAAYRQGSWLDRAVLAINSALLAVPGFVLALVLIIVFGLTLSIFPVSGWTPIQQNPAQNLRYVALPVITLAVVQAVHLLPVFRAEVVHTLEQDHITLARAKGLTRRQILFRHALRLSSIALVTLLGLSLAQLFAGTVIVETVFALPGVGSLLYDAILTKDIVTVQGIVVFLAMVYLVMNLAVDLLYTRLDPRVVTL